ncbi:MAG: WD40 repeat domain-containing protein, partial [Candidatus Omnitrophica bacterium]|nr:WD40 repeat domain-containing protein [Candidatus Omnitrophota bacterium]
MLTNEVSYELSEYYDEPTISPDQKYLLAMNNDFETMSVIDIATGDLINEWRPFDARIGSFEFSRDGQFLLTVDESSKIRAWRWDQLTNPVTERTGFAALNPRDNLKGIPSLLRTIVRFLREEEVALLEQEEATPRPESWQVTDRLEDPVSLALMNNLYDTFSREIQENPDITFSELLTMMNRLRGSNLADYVNIIRSAIEGQDKTQRAWVREIAIQNGRDATRRAREEGTLNADQGDLEIRNFMQGDDWIFSVRDHGTGMNLFQLIRYFFPLDQSSKDFLNDTGNLGQGNYTLFADFDRVFIRTSTGDGMIHELEIVPDATLGPVIEKWEVLSGNEKGTEIRRIKNNTKSDPQLESLFVQEALQRFAGGITSPQQRRRRGEAADIRDVRIPYNGETFDEEIAVTASSTLGRQGGLLAVGRAEDKLSQRVIQDGIFVKEPDQKELRFVPKWLQAAFERLGGMHIALPRNIQLNIPRTGYSQEHKFLKQLQVGVLHNILKTVLRDYVDEGLKIPGTPADYFDNYLTTEQTQAQEIVRLLHAGRYDEIDEQSLASFIENPTRLFSLMAYLPFESQAYDGEMTLHEIRERFIEQSRLRPRADGAVSIGTQTRLKDTFVPRGEFAADIEESVGNLAEAAKGIVNGRLKSWAQAQRAKTRDPQEAWDRLPANTKIFMDYLIRRFIQPVVGEEMPDIGYYNREDNASAKAGSIGMLWNLAYNEPHFARLIELSQNVGALQAELQNGPEGSVLG